MSSRNNYKALLKKVSEMRLASASALYSRMKLLVQVFNDTDFRADLGNADDFRAADALNQYLNDTPWKFLSFKALLEMFPKEAQWTEKPLKELFEQLETAKKPATDAQRSRRTVTLKEFEDLSDSLKAAEARVKFAEQRLDERTKSYDELLEENRELRRQLAVYEGRISELEKLVPAQRV